MTKLYIFTSIRSSNFLKIVNMLLYKHAPLKTFSIIVDSFNLKPMKQLVLKFISMEKDEDWKVN